MNLTFLEKIIYINNGQDVLFSHLSQAKIVDHDGHIVPVGEKGELCTRGTNNMLEYWEDPEKTRKVMGRDQWYHTG